MRSSAVVFIVMSLLAQSAHAYLGPGLGLGAVGAAFGIIFAVFLAIVGIFWYPLKRTYFKMRGIEPAAPEEEEAETDSRKVEAESS